MTAKKSAKKPVEKSAKKSISLTLDELLLINQSLKCNPFSDSMDKLRIKISRVVEKFLNPTSPTPKKRKPQSIDDLPGQTYIPGFNPVDHAKKGPGATKFGKEIFPEERKE